MSSRLSNVQLEGEEMVELMAQNHYLRDRLQLVDAELRSQTEQHSIALKAFKALLTQRFVNDGLNSFT